MNWERKNQRTELKRANRLESSIIILARNSQSTIGTCIKSIKRQSLPASEIIVVNGGSTDSTVEVAIKNGARVVDEPVLVRGKARNRGLLEAKKGIVVYIDSDAYADRDWLKYLLSSFKEDKLAGVAGNVYAANPDRPMPHLIDLMMRDKRHYATLNIAYRKRILLKVGGFNERLPSAEDVELAWRILRAGYEIGYEARSIVYHFHRESLGKFLQQQYDFGKWSMIARKWTGISTTSQELLMLVAPLTIFKHLKEMHRHISLPFLLTLASIAYAGGLSKGLSLSRTTFSEKSSMVS